VALHVFLSHSRLHGPRLNKPLGLSACPRAQAVAQLEARVGDLGGDLGRLAIQMES